MGQIYMVGYCGQVNTMSDIGTGTCTCDGTYKGTCDSTCTSTGDGTGTCVDA